MIITYIARRSLMSGHTAGTQYTADLNVVKFDRGVTAKSYPNISLDRKNTQTIFHGLDETAEITTIPLRHESAGIGQMREFLDSVMEGQYFTIDILGSTASPTAEISAILDTQEYREVTVGGLYAQFSFRLRRVYGVAIS